MIPIILIICGNIEKRTGCRRCARISYMPGGGVKNVPLLRLWISKLGNKILRYTMPNRIYTSTGIFRAYRRKVLDSLELESDGKEIHLEILSKALALGYRVKENPLY